MVRVLYLSNCHGGHLRTASTEGIRVWISKALALVSPEICRIWSAWVSALDCINRPHLLPALAPGGKAVMQTVWSRAAQARCLCNCPTCISVTAATARRTTTFTARRGIRRGDAYTVFATSFAATAVVADSRKKDARSQQWERVIGEVRAQVQAKEEEHQRRLASLSGDPEDYPVRSLVDPTDRDDFRTRIEETLQTSWREARSYDPDDSWPNVFRWAAQHQKARAAAGFQEWKGPSLTLLQSLSSQQLQKLLTDDRLLSRFYGGPNCAALDDAICTKVRSKKKLKTLEWSVAKLVLKLLFYSKTELPVHERSHLIEDHMVEDHSTEDHLTEDHLTEDHLTEDHLPIGSTPRVVTQTNGILRATCPTSPEGHMSNRITDSPDFAQESEEPRHSMQGQSIEERLAYMDEKIRLLRKENIRHANSQFFRDFESPPLPRFRTSARGTEEASALHQLLGMLIHPSKYTNKADLISKISYNLLTSDIAPNVHTYNMLLVHFCHIDSYKMFRAVLTSMRESHIRPNELTHATVLQYFTITDRGAFFMEYVLRMEGHLGGLAQEHPRQDISPIVSERYHTCFNSLGRKKTLQKARMNGEVYEALIVGALRFFGGHSALQYYRDMISEGWQASVDLLIAILKSCYRSCDWTAGVSVWYQITAMPERANRRAFEWMLCLCQACGQQTAFEKVLQDGVEAGALSSTILSLADHIKQQNSDTPQQNAKTCESYPAQTSRPATAPISWVQKHMENSIAAGTMTKSEERASENKESSTAIVVREEPANLLPVLWKFAESSGAQSEPLSGGFKPAEGNGQIARLLSKTKGTYGDIAISRALDDLAVKINEFNGKHDDIVISRAVVDLAAKIQEFNGKDIQKMNHKEYIDWRYQLKKKHERKGPIASRGVFEIFKTVARLRLDKDDQQGRLYGEPSPFTSLDLKEYIPEPGSLSSDIQDLWDPSN